MTVKSTISTEKIRIKTLVVGRSTLKITLQWIKIKIYTAVYRSVQFKLRADHHHARFIIWLFRTMSESKSNTTDSSNESWRTSRVSASKTHSLSFRRCRCSMRSAGGIHLVRGALRVEKATGLATADIPKSKMVATHLSWRIPRMLRGLGSPTVEASSHTAP